MKKILRLFRILLGLHPKYVIGFDDGMPEGDYSVTTVFRRRADGSMQLVSTKFQNPPERLR